MMLKRFNALVLSLLVLLFSGCSRQPYAVTNKVYKQQAKAFAKTLQAQPGSAIPWPKGQLQWVGTTNFNLRKPNFVIIHHTAQKSCEQTLRTFTLTKTQVSAHYVICKDGTIHHMLNDYLRAWHGGIAKWGNVTDINSSSIGIELDNDGYETFSERQIGSLLVLLDTLKQRYNVPVANFVGHGDIAPTRKNDPNVTFPWRLLADKGFGSWYTDTTLLTVPTDFNTWQALRIIGYDVKDTAAASLAFKRHFMSDTTSAMDNESKKILYSLLQKSF